MDTNLDETVTRIRNLDGPESDVLLFKFRAVNDNLDRFFIHRQIYFSAPAKLNDPFDCQHDIPKSLRRAATRMDVQRPDLLGKLFGHEHQVFCIDEATRNAGVCSFSTEFLNPLLWSHYSEGSQGVCLVFKLPQEFIQNIPEVIGFEDVNYDDLGISKWFWMDSHRYLSDVAEEEALPRRFLSKLITVLLSTKGRSWCYEKETRIVRSVPGPVEIAPEFLKGVCFGMNTPAPTRLSLIALAERSGFRCHFFEQIRNESDFGLSAGCCEGYDSHAARDLLSEILGPDSLNELIKRDKLREVLTQRAFQPV